MQNGEEAASSVLGALFLYLDMLDTDSGETSVMIWATTGAK